MTKKLLSIVMLVLVLCMLIALGNSVQAANLEAKTPTQETIDGKVFVFANGTPITIESRADGQDGATIKWGENGTMDVPADANIFGGGHEEDGVYASSSIVMNGGTVKTVFAGGLHKSHVATGNIVVNSGTIKNYVQGGGASSFSGTTCHKPWYKGNQEGATTVVDNTTIVINGGNMFGVFGGGEGIASTKNVEVTVNGGTITYLCAGGTNGYTNNATVKVTAGEVRIMQGVNRGSVDSIEAEVTGGTIENLYVVGDSSDSTVTGIAVGWHEDWLSERKETRSLLTDSIVRERGTIRYTKKFRIYSFEQVNIFKAMIANAMRMRIYSSKIFESVSGFPTSR